MAIPDPAGARYTTRAQLELEQGLLDNARDRRDEGVAIADPQLTRQASRVRGLSGEQHAVVRELTSSGHGIEVLRAPAGAGKTFALDAAREAWQRSDVRVIGCALSAQAARELHDQAGIDTTTIAGLKGELDRGRPLPAGGC